MSYARIDRISEEIKRELSNVIRELKDPRIPQMVSVTLVKVTKDLKFAKVYISVMGDEKAKKDAGAALNSGAGFIRREIGQRVDLRAIPQFNFVIDDSIDKGMKITEILHRLEKN